MTPRMTPASCVVTSARCCPKKSCMTPIRCPLWIASRPWSRREPRSRRRCANAPRIGEGSRGLRVPGRSPFAIPRWVRAPRSARWYSSASEGRARRGFRPRRARRECRVAPPRRRGSTPSLGSGSSAHEKEREAQRACQRLPGLIGRGVSAECDLRVLDEALLEITAVDVDHCVGGLCELRPDQICGALGE